MRALRSAPSPAYPSRDGLGSPARRPAVCARRSNWFLRASSSDLRSGRTRMPRARPPRTLAADADSRCIPARARATHRPNLHRIMDLDEQPRRHCQFCGVRQTSRAPQRASNPLAFSAQKRRSAFLCTVSLNPSFSAVSRRDQEFKPWKALVLIEARHRSKEKTRIPSSSEHFHIGIAVAQKISPERVVWIVGTVGDAGLRLRPPPLQDVGRTFPSDPRISTPRSRSQHGTALVRNRCDTTDQSFPVLRLAAWLE